VEFEFLPSKTGDETCRYKNVLFHSMYNPVNDAERFSLSLETAFKPKCLIIFEPALSYCHTFLKNRFPNAKLCAIRVISDFSKTDSLWDKVFYFKEAAVLENEIFNALGEENLSFCLFTAWPVSAKVFQEEYGKTVGVFKALLQKSHSILATRSCFETRWILNSLNMAIFLEHPVYPVKKTQKPVLVCCSGPSLKPLLQNSNTAEKFFIIAVSSAILPLLENNIVPDLCVSTDGGFWAKKHVEILLKNKDIPLALSCEGQVPSKLLENSPVFPLGYQDGIETKLTESANLKTVCINRNGTVSGTALELALSLSDKSIYIAGLDLMLQTGFQHTQNNALESGNASKDCKKHTVETRMTASEFSNQKASLKMYEDWFSSLNTDKKIYRIIDNPKNNLGKIKDICWKDFLQTAKNVEVLPKENIFQEEKLTKNLEKLSKTAEQIINNDGNLIEIFPLEYLQYTQQISQEFASKHKEKLDAKIENLKQKMERRLLCTKNH